jgi:hypothetical protein
LVCVLNLILGVLLLEIKSRSFRGVRGLGVVNRCLEVVSPEGNYIGVSGAVSGGAVKRLKN